MAELELMTTPKVTPVLPPSLLTDQLSDGVVYVTGKRGIGKSIFMFTAEVPQRTAFFDFEVKGRAFDRQLGFGAYHAVTRDAAGLEPAEVYDLMHRLISELPDGRFSTAIIDNVSPLEQALRAELNRNVMRYSRMFGLSAKNIENNSYGAASGCTPRASA